MKPGNLNRISTGSLSPPSAASSAGVTKSTSVPIARSSNSVWEKPERARTSHACEPCRERKTKCDGSRPACRRCLHTGSTCYYGYGKGWRKRKTAEDLSATSRRLARYENLLSEIFPLVSPEVRNLIEDARDNDLDTGASNNGSETAETEQLFQPPTLIQSDSTMSNSSGRMLLPLPLPSLGPGASPLVPTASRSSTSSSTFEVPHFPNANVVAGTNNQSASRFSPDSTAATRLPSITARGLLIEAGLRDHSPPSLPRSHESAGIYIQDHLGTLPPSPAIHTSQGESGRPPQFSPD